MARCDDVEKTLRIVVTSGLVNRTKPYRACPAQAELVECARRGGALR